MLSACLLSAACGRSPAAPSSPAPTPAGGGALVAPSLISPTNGGYVQQNDPATGCRYDPVYGYGFMVTFEWGPISGVEYYQLQLKHPYASVPLLDLQVRGTRYEYVACGIAAGDDTAWQWRVKSVRPGITESEWSPPRYLNFTPCRLSTDRGCAAAPPS